MRRYASGVLRALCAVLCAAGANCVYFLARVSRCFIFGRAFSDNAFRHRDFRSAAVFSQLGQRNAEMLCYMSLHLGSVPYCPFVCMRAAGYAPLAHKRGSVRRCPRFSVLGGHYNCILPLSAAWHKAATSRYSLRDDTCSAPHNAAAHSSSLQQRGRI